MLHENCETQDKKQHSENPIGVVAGVDGCNWKRSKSDASFFSPTKLQQFNNSRGNISEHSTVYWDLPEAVESSESELKTPLDSIKSQDPDFISINPDHVAEFKKLLTNTGGSNVKIHHVHFQEHLNVKSDKYEDSFDRRQSTPIQPFHTFQECESFMQNFNVNIKKNTSIDRNILTGKSTKRLPIIIDNITKPTDRKFSTYFDEQIGLHNDTDYFETGRAQSTSILNIQDEIKSQFKQLKFHCIKNKSGDTAWDATQTANFTDIHKTLENCNLLIKNVINYSGDDEIELHDAVCKLVQKEHILETIMTRLTYIHASSINTKNPTIIDEIDGCADLIQSTSVNTSNNNTIQSDHAQVAHNANYTACDHVISNDRTVVILLAKLLTEIISQNYLFDFLIGTSNNLITCYGADNADRISVDREKESACDVVDQTTSISHDVNKEEQCGKKCHQRDKILHLLKQVIKQSWEYRSDARIYREYLGIMEPLLKHSETLCKMVVDEGGLRCLVYACRSDDLITLRHTVLGLTNLALFGTFDSLDQLIREHVIDWMFCLAYHKDDVIKYFACLASAILSNNPDLHSIVYKSGTLELVLPFVSHNSPIKFARNQLSTAFNYSTTTHYDKDIKFAEDVDDTSDGEGTIFNRMNNNDGNNNCYYSGASNEWLQRLSTMLHSQYLETRVLATFHFVVESVLKTDFKCQKILHELNIVEKFQEVIRCSISIESELAYMGLKLLDAPIPYLLCNDVPLWTDQDVKCWLQRKGFTMILDRCTNFKVDGDLLLRLDDEILTNGFHIDNPIILSKLMRELRYLKCNANYSAVDSWGLAQWLNSVSETCHYRYHCEYVPIAATDKYEQKQAPQRLYYARPKQLIYQYREPNISISEPIDLKQYTYNMIMAGVHPTLMPVITDQILMYDCHIRNSIHRKLIIDAVQNLNSNQITENGSVNELKYRPIDAFISYRRATGSNLASLLKVHLQLKGYRVFLDVDRLGAGRFPDSLVHSINRSSNFLLILTPNTLDRCVGDEDQQDWIHREIVCAFQGKCNIIPITYNFVWPSTELLPEDLKAITKYNAVEWNHQYQEASIVKIEKFLVKPNSPAIY